MKYLWTEDQGAGLHFWQLVNQYLFQNKMVIESKGSNQGLLDAVRSLEPAENDAYYLAFDIVYDNMDVVNKLLELQELKAKYPEQIIMLDMTCFEHIIFSFSKLIEWTGSGHKDVINMRKYILEAIKDHRINLEEITDEKTKRYLMGFKRFSTERVIKSMTYMLTDGDAWSVKGRTLGDCWHKDCCVLSSKDNKKCHLGAMTGFEKMEELLSDTEFQRIASAIQM
ncbi:hypothetical protein [Ruminococcus sp. 5_1_39BFAA]|uniref:hypothetical protein n=1 Tax=Ruminococcus sp. 5_1_39BFAA TaxID=457412 RepID=UPI003563BFFF